MRRGRRRMRRFSRMLTRVGRPKSELKRLDIDFDPTSITFVHQRFNLYASLSQGTNRNNRIGNIVFVEYIYIFGRFLVGDASNIIRSTVVEWRDEADAGYNIYQGCTTNPWDDFLNHENGVFKVKHDKRFTLSNTSSISGLFQKYIRWRIPVRKYVEFATGTTTARRNAIEWVLVSDSTTAPDPTFHGCVKVRFRDP